ncbi:DeoR/GlpR family DNA-binding transcription regulator [Streptococcus cameli]
MLKTNRKKEILKMVEQLDVVSYQELANTLNVSTMTVRRDVAELEKENAVIKEHGGVRKLMVKIKTTDEKRHLFSKEKDYIAEKAATLITPNSVIYLDAGTTILALAKHLQKDHKHIITNSLFTFNWLIENQFKNVLLTGGEFVSKTEEFHGQHAERLVRDFSIDYAFLATNGLIDENLTTFSPFSGRLQSTVIEQSKMVYLVADHSKFGQSDSYIYGKLNQVDAIISDNKLDSSIKKHYEQYTNIIN